jgi:hypothetical protein
MSLAAINTHTRMPVPVPPACQVAAAEVGAEDKSLRGPTCLVERDLRTRTPGADSLPVTRMGRYYLGLALFFADWKKLQVQVQVVPVDSDSAAAGGWACPVLTSQVL